MKIVSEISVEKLYPVAKDTVELYFNRLLEPSERSSYLVDWHIIINDLPFKSDFFFLLKVTAFHLTKGKPLYQYNAEDRAKIFRLELNTLDFIKKNEIFFHEEITGPLLTLFKLQVCK